MVLQHFIKRSAEIYTKAIDYTDQLPSGVTPSSATVSGICLGDGSSAAALLGSATVSGNTTLIPIQGGTDGLTYLITVTTTLSNSNVLVDQFSFTVYDREL